MAEIGTGITALAIALGGKDFLAKILGPTADYIGEQAKLMVEKRVQNTSRIFQKAHRILGPKLDEPGTVPPRVLKEILENGSFCDEELSAEYFGGILASSRSGISRDDRAMTMLDLIKSLPNYQIRTHYIFYQIFRNEFLDSNVKISTEFNTLKIYIPARVYIESMNFEKEEDLSLITSHSIPGLASKDLISQEYLHGSIDFLKSNLKNKAIDIDPDGGIIFGPTILGSQLFLWVNGHPNELENNLISRKIKIDILDDVKISPGFKRII
jgi:hypothetical protein